MTMMISRRQAIAGTLLAVPTITGLSTAVAAKSDGGALEGRLRTLEERHGGRLGVSIQNLATGARLGHRADELFLMCSTSKALLGGFILARVDRGEEKLDRRIPVKKADLLDWAPVVGTRVGADMSVAELCEATITWSDNAAANILLASFGGPTVLTDFLRSTGDGVSRLDRTEPTLNTHEGPDDERDTSTPDAMLETLRKLVFGDVLSRRSKAQFATWLVMNKTGDTRIRAGFPDDWIAGDKTGTNGDTAGNANDVAIGWSPDRGAVLVVVFYEVPGISGDERNAVIAEVGRISVEV
ncbi:class A beta-lactamase [Rhizobium sp. TRM95111]|uniref:class A beta-lactamase n=1 Tax=Rhizobium alarense TaxID=2846851 RepID=UPI001EFF261E|nr:class A beta-lactamase [Rhizobium alarense]MCF3641682.1 class A beta-lactamase [Rhizobium alarense]